MFKHSSKTARNASHERISQQEAWDVPTMTSIPIEKMPDVI